MAYADINDLLGRYFVIDLDYISAFRFKYRPVRRMFLNMKKQNNDFSELSKFYRLVEKVMAHLAGAQGEEIDVGINKCLALLGKHFGVESVSLGGISKSGELMPALYLWGRLPPKAMMLASTPTPGSEMVAQWNRAGYLISFHVPVFISLPNGLGSSRTPSFNNE